MSNDVFAQILLFTFVVLVIAHVAVYLPDYLIRRAKRTPYFHLRDGDYMRRWWLVPYLQRKYRTEGTKLVVDGTGPVSFWRRPIAWVIQRCGLAIRVHEIMDSDRHRHPHNHPWWYVTIIMDGWYWEDRYAPDGRHLGGQFHGPGHILFRRANSFHSLTLPGGPHGSKVTTLFITGTKSQPWGFVTEEGFVPHMTYKAQHKLKLE
jgi:hypothetical protein